MQANPEKVAAMYGIEHKLIAILFSGGLLAQAYFVRVYVGTWLVPAALFPLAWFAFTFFPLVLLPEVPINAVAVLYIWICAIAFSFSAYPFTWKHALKRNAVLVRERVLRFDSKFMRRFLYASSVLSMIFSLLTMIANGWSVEEILFDLLATSGRYAALRGNEGVEYGLVGTVSIFFTYISPVLGALISSTEKKAWKKIRFFLFGMTPAIFAMVTQSSKLIFLVAFSFYIGAVLSGKVLSNRLILFRASQLPKFLIGASLLLPFVMVSFLSREGASDSSGDLNATLDLLRYSMASYVLGQVYAFSDFFSYAVSMPSVSVFLNDFGSLGAYTFASVFDTLGIGKAFPPGLYEETGFYPEVFETNIFTIYRGLIYDFGIPGSVVVVYLLGLIANTAFYKLMVGRRPWGALCVYGCSFVFIVISYLISAFMARYMFLNAIAMYLILAVNAWLSRRRPWHKRRRSEVSGASRDPVSRPVVSHGD